MVELRLQGVLRARRCLHRRMAGACRERAGRAGSRVAPRVCRRSAARGARGAHTAWRSLACVLAVLCVSAAAQAQVVATRIWPAPEYTRLTLESTEELKFSLFSVKGPERLVL